MEMDVPHFELVRHEVVSNLKLKNMARKLGLLKTASYYNAINFPLIKICNVLYRAPPVTNK
jgi:hypothetical protein